jgi:hypothetical protein
LGIENAIDFFDPLDSPLFIVGKLVHNKNTRTSILGLVKESSESFIHQNLPIFEDEDRY